MATIKLKFRPSSVKDREGTLFYQIIHLREVRQIYTDLHLHAYEWDGDNSSVIITSTSDTKRMNYLLSVSRSLKYGFAKLATITSQLDGKGAPYTARDVVSAYNAPITVVGVVSFTQKLIADMKKIGKRSTANRLEVCLSSFLRYTNGNEVAWPDLNSTFMLGYEEHMMKRGLCRNSTSCYMRSLRSVLNRAAEENYEVPRNLFRHVYMGVDKTVKRAVTLDTVCRIRDLDLSGHPSLDFARNVFMFAFYTRGMSFVDIAFLKKSDVSGDMITYSRRKTRQQLRVRIEPVTRRTIDDFGKNESQYLLPILSESGGDVELQYVNAYNRVNRNIKKIGKMLGLETKLTLYVARHAWASIAHKNNVPLSIISKAMGHDSENTTLIYLQSLDTSSVDKANSDIIKMMDDRKK
ncbi:MAG: site-specific integrase [Muribaculaceae bacterium]|nr:site-specific integrase [Muribaculaceae bacterium]